MNFTSKVTTIGGILLLGLAVLNPANAQSIAEFYKGKTISLIIGSGSAGSYNRYARTLARHMGKHIPGNPSFVAQNMPGAGATVAASHLFTKAAKDGTVIGAIQRTTHLDPLLFPGKYQFKATEFKWLGSLATVTNLIITWHTAKVKNLKDLLSKKVILAATGARTDGVIFPKLLNQWLGGNIKVVAGYKGSGSMFLAMERGEVTGRGGVPWATVKSARGEWVKDKKIDIPLQLAMKKDPELPNVDFLLDYVKDPAQRAAFELLFGRQEMGRPYVIPPGVPADRVKALRQAFVDTTKDPAFQADLKKQKFTLTLRTGKQVQAIVEKAYATDKKTLDMMRKVLAK